MRITAELIGMAPVYLNPSHERQLCLRGYKIPAIENLGGTLDTFDCLDFCDNDIAQFGNFPLLKRVTTVLVSNNKISIIADGLGKNLPKLENIMLTNNKMLNLVDLIPLAEFTKLQRVCLIGNPVARLKDYRLYVIALLPKLRVLDFQKVKPQERVDALLKFGVIKKKDADEVEEEKEEPAKTFVPGQGAEVDHKITPALKEAIKTGIANATSLEEIDALEKALSTGKIPRSLATKLNLSIESLDNMDMS